VIASSCGFTKRLADAADVLNLLDRYAARRPPSADRIEERRLSWVPLER
jgi:hypothetical protein